MRREVEIAEPEPRDVGLDRPQLLRRAEGFAPASPPAIAIEHIAEPVGDGIRVGGDVQAVHHDVVGNVDDHREVGPGDDPREPSEELPRADPAGERRDLHGTLVVVRMGDLG